MATRKIDFLLNVKGNASNALNKLGDSSVKAAKGMERAKDSAKDVGGELASLGGMIGGIPIPGFEGLGRAVTAAGDSMEALSGPMGATIVLFGGAAAITGAVTAAVIGLTMAADDWLKELEEINAAGDLVSPAQVASIEAANQAVTALGASTKRVGVLLAAEFADDVESAAIGLVALVRALEQVDLSFVKTFTVGGGPVALASRMLSEMSGGIIPSFESALDSLNSRLLSMTGLDKIISQTREIAAEMKEAADEILIFGPTQEQAGFKPSTRKKDGPITRTAGLGGSGSQPQPVTIADDDLSVAVTKNSLSPMVEAMDKQRESTTRAILAATGSTESLVRAIPVVGGMVADIGGAMLNLPSLVNGLRGDLIEGPLKIGKAFNRTMQFAIPKLIDALPQILGNLLFKLPAAIARGIVLGIPKILMAFVKAIGDAIKNALNFLKGGEDGNVLTGKRGKFLGTSFKKGEGSFLGLGNRKKDGFATGGFVPRTDSYLLHAGERVIPPTGASTGTARAVRGLQGGGGMSVGNMTINMQTNDVRDMIRQIARELGSFGTGGSLTPRGG